MSNFLNSIDNSLLPGIHHGRVLELINNEADLKESSSRNVLNILVLIEDQVFSIEIEKKSEIIEGAFISFYVNKSLQIEKVKAEKSPKKLNANGDLIRWRRPSKKPSRMSLLRLRHKLMQGVREWFDKKNFLEAETPFLVRAPSPESQILPIRTDSGFLITSPEFQMKRLLVGGFEKIYQLARCFRGNEIGSQHNPEFTMLEWYRSGKKLDVMINDLEQLVVHLSKKIEDEVIKFIPEPPWPRIKVKDLFEKHLGIFLDGSETAEELMKKAKNSGYGKLFLNITNTSKPTQSLAYENVFSLLWSKIETKIPRSTPLFVYEWPLHLPSLAKICCEDRGFVERVELYVKGMELANGFCELTDAYEQRFRFETDLENRSALGYKSVPLDEKFLSSLEEGMPKSSGMALGVDRLIMWMCGVEHIREVLCFAENEV